MEAMLYLYTSMDARKLHGINYFGFWINIAITYSYMMCIDVFSYLRMYTHPHPVLPSKLFAEIYWSFFCKSSHWSNL